MKKILLIIYVLILFSFKLVAQDFPPPGSYTANNTMTPFHGRWLWTDGIDSVTLILQTKKTFIPMNYGFFWDRLLGWHQYKRKGVVVESTLMYAGDTARRIFVGGNEAYGMNVVLGYIKDMGKKKSGELFLTLDTTITPNRLTWKLQNSEGIRYQRPNDPPYDWGFTLPRNMVLIKQ